MDLYIFCVVLGGAGMAAMAFLGFTSSHTTGHGGHDSGGHDTGGHDTGGHDMHGAGAGHLLHTAHAGPHGHAVTPPQHSSSPHSLTAHEVHLPHPHAEGWKSHLWSWLSPRVLFNFLVGFGATGLITERLIGPVLALPVAVIGGVAFEAFIVRPIFNSLFRFESQPAETLESTIMSEAHAVTGFDANGNGLVSVEMGGEIVQILGMLTLDERNAGVRVRAGDIVRIEEVDAIRNRCTVSRIGLGAA